MDGSCVEVLPNVDSSNMQSDPEIIEMNNKEDNNKGINEQLKHVVLM